MGGDCFNIYIELDDVNKGMCKVELSVVQIRWCPTRKGFAVCKNHDCTMRWEELDVGLTIFIKLAKSECKLYENCKANARKEF
jgi:hypothetical protein